MTRALLEDEHTVWTDPETRFLHPTVLNMWRKQNPARRADVGRFDLRERGKQTVVRQLTRALHEAGVPLFLGSDAAAPGMFPGKSAHVELAELVAAGLTPHQALATATSNPGRFFQRYDDAHPPFGTITASSRADLLLLDHNPLTDISNAAQIAGVLVRGAWYSRSQITTMRSERAAEPAH